MPDGSESFACHDGCGATGATAPATAVYGGGKIYIDSTARN
jgi:hypothetical protein